MCSVDTSPFAAVSDLHGVFEGDSLLAVVSAIVVKLGADNVHLFNFYHNGLQVSIRVSIEANYI